MSVRKFIIWLIAVLYIYPVVAGDSMKRVAAGNELYDKAKCAECHSIQGIGNKNIMLDSFIVKALGKEEEENTKNLMEAMKSHGPKPKKQRIPLELSDDDFYCLSAYLRSCIPDYGPAPTDLQVNLLLPLFQPDLNMGSIRVSLKPVLDGTPRRCCIIQGFCGWSVHVRFKVEHVESPIENTFINLDSQLLKNEMVFRDGRLVTWVGAFEYLNMLGLRLDGPNQAYSDTQKPQPK